MSTPSRLVAQGYDRIADAYLDRFGPSAVRQKWLVNLLAMLPLDGGRVLDLGCGAGLPVAAALAARGHSVLGVDVSAEQLARARRNVPKATFIQEDMSDLVVHEASFDVVAAFYSITHLPAVEQAPLLAKIGVWLKPGGCLVASLGTGPAGDWTGDWMGTNMFFGHAGEAALLDALLQAGMTLRQSLIDQQDDEDARFLWIVAQKPASLE